MQKESPKSLYDKNGRPIKNNKIPFKLNYIRIYFVVVFVMIYLLSENFLGTIDPLILLLFAGIILAKLFGINNFNKDLSIFKKISDINDLDKIDQNLLEEGDFDEKKADKIILHFNQ